MGDLKHVAIIMDGNGRWGKLHSKTRSAGHRAGAKALEKIVAHGFEKGLLAMSFYAFSTENWARPKEEVNALLSLLSAMLKKNLPTLIENKIRLRISGDLSPLSKKRRELVEEAVEKTASFEKTVNICFNYGSRAEILRAVNSALKKGLKEVDEAQFESLLYTDGLPEVDLVIRASGEQRLSNFLLWQCAYSELYFTPVLWPDFCEKDLDEAMEWFSSRNRRFGKIEP